MTVGSADSSLFNVGIPLSGIQVCIYYYVFAKLAERFNWSNVSYWIIFWQLVIAIVISAVSAGLWIAVAYEDASAGCGQEATGPTAISPILMGMVGMGGIYAFYPAIAPYKLTDVGTGYTIDLVVLFMSAVPGSGVARSIKSSGLKVGLITITLKFCEEGLKAVSYAGGGAYKSPIPAVNTFASQGLMIILAFTGDGYLKTYSKYENDRDKWPTRDYGTFRSICYWTWSGMKVACKSVKSSFTKNVRCKVLGKSEALLIVYEDEEF
ncbi:hypothetical protein BEWA_002240 [Theileria equi strain WA]|uniref:Uncharacterized protein n=1 Tax=Theileria equi strain WA TaxID=1537102 RepID=L0AYZ8_THEEQ|nr:hypothetical protein BEWA_002240 [Theileria equi strain WA]AFZ80817.1 hypothetical protein BEWA_002240 [Theileria equi strain WA]|eukprot:XP_004830483.1 hypothetical protein BEWA_002240 [Theileria equi strain WA]